MQTRFPSLVFCLWMDFMGVATYALPMGGEFIDIAWAPLSAWFFYKIFGGRRGKAGAILHGLEEVLAGTDFIPAYTLMWCMQHVLTYHVKMKTGSLYQYK